MPRPTKVCKLGPQPRYSEAPSPVTVRSSMGIAASRACSIKYFCQVASERCSKLCAAQIRDWISPEWWVHQTSEFLKAEDATSAPQDPKFHTPTLRDQKASKKKRGGALRAQTSRESIALVVILPVAIFEGRMGSFGVHLGENMLKRNTRQFG